MVIQDLVEIIDGDLKQVKHTFEMFYFLIWKTQKHFINQIKMSLNMY